MSKRGGGVYPSYLKLPLCWLRSLTRITYYSKLIGMRSLAALTQLQLFWVYFPHYKIIIQVTL
ncbi:hypothetical protein CT690_05665 [Serratia plymuthica]|uniref:Uncharacterized protein n=1 Tax=Serratia plymuthica TaxID=82996 RepID=A0A318P5G5_SERPL|nr:hypothetical protein CT690_05665 [Serratia plymuthica]